jgi:hypothetical protein
MCLIQYSALVSSKYLQAVSRSPNLMKYLPLSKVYELLEPARWFCWRPPARAPRFSLGVLK